MAIYRRFRVQQKYVNGKPTEEYRLGVEIDSTDYNSLEECNRGSECTELEYRWVDMESADDYICDGTNKYKKQMKQQKCVTEEAWTNVYPYEYQKGELIEHDSVDCGYDPSVEYHIYGATDGHGSITISPSKEYYSSADVVTITALPSTDYIFSCYNYGGNMTYGRVAYNSVLSLTMSHNWYVSAAFVYGVSSTGSLFYLYSDDTHSWYDWSKSTLSKDDNTGWKASVIIDYSGVIQTISSTAFRNHTYLTEIILPNCSYIGSYAFQSCYSLTSINLPNCLSVDSCGFDGCSSLTSVNLTNCSYIGRYAFAYCSALKSIDLPNCTYVSREAFYVCEALTSISLPLCEYVGFEAFAHCHSLSSINLPNCSYVESDVFYDCSVLKTIRLPKVTYFKSAALGDTSIQTLYMDQITSVPLGRDPFSGYLGYLKSIFIPCSLLNDFTTHSIWSKYSSYYVCASETKDILTATDGGGTITLDPEGGIYTSGTTVNIGYKEKYGYEFNHFQYGSTSAYGSTVLSENFSLVMNQNWYVSAAFSISASLGTLYYSYWNSTESWYVWALSRFTKYNNNGSNADTIIDYSGVIKTLPTSAFRLCSDLTTISLPNCSYIGSYAFYSTALVSVNLPKCITVDSFAFQKCRWLKYIDLTSCEYIARTAFNSCTDLQSINLPNCIFISYFAFADCTSLTSISLPLCEFIDYDAFETCYALKSVDLPNCTYVSRGAFFDCKNLINVKLPKVTYIGHNAFTNTRIETLYMNQITSVPSGGDPFGSTFSYLKSIIIPCSLINDFTINSIWSKYSSYFVCDSQESDLKEIFTATDGGGTITLDPEGGKYYSGTTVNIGYSANPGYVFSYLQYGSTPAYGSTVLNESFSLVMSQNWYVSVNFDYGTASSGSLYYSYNTGSESWYDWSKSTLSKGDNNGDGASIIIDYGGIVQIIPSSAFSPHSYLTKIVFPNCTYVNVSAFEKCSVLSSISLPNCSYIGSYAFYSCYSLPSIDLPNCSYVGSYAFNECLNLTSINLPLCSYVGAGAFGRCTSLLSIDLPNCTSVGSYAFQSCYSLTSIDLPLCSYVGAETFESCSVLTSINLPNCTYVSYAAFDYCLTLTSIDLPLCSYVGSYVFFNCQKLTSIILPLCEFIGGSAFAHCSILPSIDLPNCSLISYFAFGYCESLTSISLPNCTYVSDYAFTHCSLLKSIYLPLCSYVCRYAFEYCRSLTSVNLPKVTYFGSHVFESAPVEILYMDQITSVPSGDDPSINSSYIKSIFIPCSLLDSFVSHSIWSRFSSYFVCV